MKTVGLKIISSFLCRKLEHWNGNVGLWKRLKDENYWLKDHIKFLMQKIGTLERQCRTLEEQCQTEDGWNKRQPVKLSRGRGRNRRPDHRERH